MAEYSNAVMFGSGLRFSAKENFCVKINCVKGSENDAEFRKKTKYATISQFFLYYVFFRETD